MGNNEYKIYSAYTIAEQTQAKPCSRNARYCKDTLIAWESFTVTQFPDTDD